MGNDITNLDYNLIAVQKQTVAYQVPCQYRAHWNNLPELIISESWLLQIPVYL